MKNVKYPPIFMTTSTIKILAGARVFLMKLPARMWCWPRLLYKKWIPIPGKKFWTWPASAVQLLQNKRFSLLFDLNTVVVFINDKVLPFFRLY